ncbi:MAG: carboxypeptidase [Leptospiraceae bacterium]|nr:MAG: carboxypeptidase [Leptospiraceae bacterium]
MKQLKHSNINSNIFENKNYFERIIFTFLNQIIKKNLQKPNYLLRTFIIFILSLLLLPVLMTFYLCDPVIIWLIEDYERPSIVYGYNSKGEIVPYAEFYSQNRKIIELTENDFKTLSVIKTFIAAEDIRFKEHFGIDIPGIIRAMIINFLAGKIKEGASTLTQQTARLRFLSRERTIIRKLREISLSLWLELKYPKHKILEIYFNEVPLGHGTLGIEAASQFYFGKNFRELSIGEASVLSSLTTAPNIYSPLKNPIKSISKMEVTFKRLVENGEIPIEEAEKEFKNIVQNYIITLNRYPDESSYTNRLNLFPYATEYLRRILPDEIKENLENGGYEIYTTLNVDKQKIAEKSLQDWLKQLNKNKVLYKKPFKNFEIFDEHFNEAFPILKVLFGIADFKQKITKEERDFQIKFLSENRDYLLLLNYLFGERNIINALENHLKKEIDDPSLKPDYIEGALVSLNPLNGKLEAIVGGSKFIPANQLLRFLSQRQPGSALKPFIYSAGIDHYGRNIEDKEHQFTAATILDDTPLTFIDKDLSEYEPENYGGNYLGPIRVREALVLSRNTATIQAYTKIGSDIVNSYLEKILNLPENSLPKEATVALGSYEVTPLQLATAYTIFPRNGSIIQPYFIEKIIKKSNKKNKVIYKAEKPNIKEILLPETAFIIKDILKDVVKQGTGRAAYIPGIPVYGKTGTSNRFTNAWFAGFTPDNVTVIYIGYDKNISLGPGSSGGSIAAPVWRNYIYNVIKEFNYSYNYKEKIPPRIIQKPVCSLTGQIPYSSQCNPINEYFIIGTEPDIICEIHSKKHTK